MKKTLLLFNAFILISCNNNKELEILRKENEALIQSQKLSKSDSLSIFNAIVDDLNREYAIKLLDSLKIADPKKYNAIINESEGRDLVGDTYDGVY